LKEGDLSIFREKIDEGEEEEPGEKDRS